MRIIFFIFFLILSFNIFSFEYLFYNLAPKTNLKNSNSRDMRLIDEIGFKVSAPYTNTLTVYELKQRIKETVSDVKEILEKDEIFEKLNELERLVIKIKQKRIKTEEDINELKDLIINLRDQYIPQTSNKLFEIVSDELKSIKLEKEIHPLNVSILYDVKTQMDKLIQVLLNRLILMNISKINENLDILEKRLTINYKAYLQMLDDLLNIDQFNNFEIIEGIKFFERESSSLPEYIYFVLKTLLNRTDPVTFFPDKSELLTQSA